MLTTGPQIALHFDPISFYDHKSSRTGKTPDISAAFLQAVANDKHLLQSKRSTVAQKVIPLAQWTTLSMTFSFAFQIAHYIFTRAHSTIAALDLEIRNSVGYALRPATYAAIDRLYPKSIYDDAWATSTGGHDMEVMPEFFQSANVGSRDLRLEIKRFADEMRHKPARHPAREHPSMSVRACSVTTTRMPAASTNIVRDFSFFCKVGIVEHYLLEHVQYRQPLLNTALGEVRNALHGIIDGCVERYTMRHPRTRQVIQVHSWLFIDMLDTPQDARANAVDHSLFIAAARRGKAQDALISHIQAVKDMVHSHPSSQDAAQRTLDENIACKLENLLSDIHANGHRQIQCEYDGTFESPDVSARIPRGVRFYADWCRPLTCSLRATLQRLCRPRCLSRISSESP